MSDNIPAQLAALKTAAIGDLKDQWRRLLGTEPPAYNRRHLESRLAYRIQELAYGGLSPTTLKRLNALTDALEQRKPLKVEKPKSDRPVTGTRLIREYRGVEYCVTVRRDDFEFEGRPYKSLSAAARAITGTPWNGPIFFGLKRPGAGR